MLRCEQLNESDWAVIFCGTVYEVAWAFESVEKILGVTTQMKATEQYFSVVLFIMLYKVVLTFESLDKILWCDHLNESYWAVFSCGTVHYSV